MSSTPVPSAEHSLSATMTGLHHVGHVVRDMNEAREVYRRLGFRTPPAAFPALAPEPGAPARVFGAGNTHAHLERGFVELVTVLGEGDTAPDDARPHLLEAPPEALEQLTRAVDEASGRIRAALERFEGLHILAFEADDIDSAAAGLSAAGVAHGGAHRLQRPVETEAGTGLEPVAFLELDAPGHTPEGRIAVAEAVGARPVEHPNGALALVETVLTVPDTELAGYAQRYEAYTGRPARRAGSCLIFDLEGSRLALVGGSDLASVVPGARVPALPGFAAYAVEVGDLAVTAAHLRAHGVPFEPTSDGGLAVPASAALGTAVFFQAAAAAL